MEIIIIRHEKVDMIWDKTYSSITYDKACDKYDNSPIISDMQSNYEVDIQKKIYISELIRTYETAIKLFGEADFIKTPLINEVPIKSFKATKRIYPLWVWNVLGRLQWLMNNKRQTEGKKETIIRAKEMIAFLEKNQEDCYLITHGFFIRTFVKELKKQGYKIKRNRKFGVSNLDKIIAIK